MNHAVLNPPLKWHGGKTYLAKKIIELMPQHIHYVEPYFGGGAVLLEKDPEGVSEVANDINRELINFWAVLRSPEAFEAFRRCIEATPCSEGIFDGCHPLAKEFAEAVVSRAWAFFVRCRQSRAGCFKEFTTLAKTRTRRGMNELPSAWLTAIEGLPAVHARLKRVVILNRDALEVIRTQDGPETLFYCDPPYLHETRQAKDVYEHEMSFEDHCKLLVMLPEIKGKFMLSGYKSPLYTEAEELNKWTRHDFDLPNNAAGGKNKRRMTECVWCNF